jgi:hypothetical protein
MDARYRAVDTCDMPVAVDRPAAIRVVAGRIVDTRARRPPDRDHPAHQAM